MKKTLLLLALFLWTGTQIIFAQDRTVKGKVLDENGEGIPGASVKIKGTSSGAVTDIDGNYELSVPTDKNTLEISGIGVASQDVNIGDGTAALATTLKASSNTEIQGVSIYGQKVDKKSFTGSISTITSQDIARRPITDITKALEGAAPGVSVTSGGGQPGASPDIQVRGQNTLSASGAPLIVLDGAPYAGTLVSINPNDVESMTILKDAAATSIYGSRGSNGVILIITKRGVNSGKPRISIDASVGMLNRFLPLYETTDSKDYLEVAYEAWRNGPGANQSNDANTFLEYLGNYNPYTRPISEVMTISQTEKPGFFKATIDPNATLAYDDNWFNELNRTGVRQNYNLAVSNGDGKSDYYFSVGYVNEQGIIKNSNYDRISSRLTVNSAITPWLKSGMSLSAALDKQRFFVGGADNQQSYINPFMTAQVMGPIYPVYRYDSSGNKMFDENGEALYDFGVNDSNNPAKADQNRPFATNINPLAALYKDDRTTTALNGFGNAYLEAKVLKDFTLRSNFILNYRQSLQTQYQNLLFGDAQGRGGDVTKTNTQNFTYTFNQLLTWKPSFSGLNPGDGDGHNIDLVLGHENYLEKNTYLQASRSGFTGPEFQEIGAAALANGSYSAVTELAIESYFSMLSYNYRNKYYFSASLRTDGSSRFSPESRWGTFWSFGAGWMLSEESFIKDNVSWINVLKLRGSYGVAGNEKLTAAGPYAWMPRYEFIPNNANPGLRFLTFGNPELKWEGSYKFNIGFDFGLFSNRVNGNIDYFNSGANNLLFVTPFALSVGSSGIYSNVGSMKNSGVELQLNADVVRRKKNDGFNWNIRLNLTHLKNKITETQGKDTLFGGGTILTKGLSVNTFFMPHFAGVDPESGLSLYSKADGSTTTDYVSLGNADKQVFGSSFRDLEGSLTNTFTYGNFDFSFLISFGLGGKFYDGTYAGLMSSSRGQAYAADIVNRWQKPGDVTDVPRVQYDATIPEAPLSDRFLVSNSFINIKNLNLGYTIPANVLKRMSLSSLRIYVAADNVFYKSARKGLDVQQDFFGSSSFTYFPYRTIMFGLNLGL